MTRIALALLIGAVIAGLWARRSRARRREAGPLPELNKHPERLDQMLDPTDDA
jgi:hypothetical protein